MSKFSELSFYIMTSLHTKFELPTNFSSIFLNFTSYLINYAWNWRQNGSKFSELSFYIIMSLYTKFGLPANFLSIFLNFTSYLINYSGLPALKICQINLIIKQRHDLLSKKSETSITSMVRCWLNIKDYHQYDIPMMIDKANSNESHYPRW